MEIDSLIEIREKLKKILVSDLSVSSSVLAPDDGSTPLLGRGIGLDSMETLALVAAIEKEFDIEIEDEELTADLFSNLNTLSQCVSWKLGEQKK